MLIKSKWTLKVNKLTLLPCAYNVVLVKNLYQKMYLDFVNIAIPEITFSGIIGNYKKEGDFYCLSPDEEYYFSLSGLETNASHAIKNLQLNSSLDFLGVNFEIINRENQITSYEELYSNLVANDPQGIKEYNIQFLSPTSFAQGKTKLPLPIPSLMFRSWLDKWNYFCNIYLGGDELTQYLSENIYLNYYRLYSRQHYISQQKITGFTGEIKLKIPLKIDDLLANVANLLIHYADYCGTGIKTRLGMGNTFLTTFN
ncbi:CRISPR system precrRNA processing endoribonuclease RAMP protein Cas6 [Geminocystis herdmanii]|uniref:CRISPR system precrRNA processing endoribonuclease RAMP protein Cas6 n=1 Tax=Geminocystis herdmanii TaxID=669359 RepID=UPI0003485C80|nr:CRISPR system precrRNA processing endoribonuclease RAMP protein Cas6 [Geminocystis herdmanii]